MTTDLDPRFRRADHLPAPDLWAEIERRAEDPERGPAHDRRRWLTIALAAAIAAGAFAGLWRAFNGNGHPAAGLHANGPIAFSKTVGVGPDGLAITQLWARDPATGRTIEVKTTTGSTIDPVTTSIIDAVWSPDGSEVAYRRLDRAGGFRDQPTISTVRTDGAADTRRLACTFACTPYDLTWSPDSSRLAWIEVANNGDEAIRVDTIKGAVAKVATICKDTTCGDDLAQLAWSPDGSRLAFSNQRPLLGEGSLEQRSSIWIAAADGSSRRRLTPGAACAGSQHCTADSSPVWSPDGRSLVFIRTDLSTIDRKVTLMEMGADGTDVHALLPCRFGSCIGPVVWSPDGSTLAGVWSGSRWDPKTGSIVLVDATTGAVLHRLEPARNPGCAQPGDLSWSPDGNALLVTAHPWLTTNLCVVPADGASPTIVAHDVADDGSQAGAWLPAGSIDLENGATPAAVPPKAALVSTLPLPPGEIVFGVQHVPNGQPAGGTYHVQSDGGGFGRSKGACASTFSPDGTFTACASATAPRTAVIVRRGDSQVATLPAPKGVYVEQPTWSPSDLSIAYTSSTGRGGTFRTDLRIFYPESTGDRLLAPNETDPSWSPDGTQIAATPPNKGFTDGRSEIDVITVPGGVVKPIIQLPGVVSDLAWSPDGEWIAFRWDTVTSTGIWLVHPDGSQLRMVPTATDARTGQIAWSPDSQYLVFGAGDSHRRRGLYAARISDGATTMLVRAQPGVGDVVWVPGSS